MSTIDKTIPTNLARRDIVLSLQETDLPLPICHHCETESCGPTTVESLTPTGARCCRFSHGFGLWVGARARGDARLAKHIAGRLSIKLFDPRDLFIPLNPSAGVLGVLDERRWRRVFLGYIKGREDSNALLTASGDSAHKLGLALLTIAMRSKSRESRIDHLHQILKIANPDRSWTCARGLLLRCERDRAFLQTARGNNPSG